MVSVVSFQSAREEELFQQDTTETSANESEQSETEEDEEEDGEASEGEVELEVQSVRSEATDNTTVSQCLSHC